MFASALKWAGVGIITSYIIASCKKQVTLTSLTEAPSDLYPPEFYPNGTDLQLPFGTMRYWQFGDEGGSRVVLIHGMTTGSSAYDKLARDLADNAHRVLVYDLWGRGYSQAPAANYDNALYTSQLAMLLQKVGWEKTNVVGVSLGGAIATGFTALYPEMVNKLVLIAPTGLTKDSEKLLIFKALNVPFVHHFITTHPCVHPLLTGFIERFAKKLHKVEPGLDTETAATISKISKITTYQIVHHPGFLRAVVNTAVSFPFTDMAKSYREVGLQNRSILMIWGDQDTIVPFDNHKKALELMPNAKLIVHEDKGHDVIITLWRTVNQEIEDFLNSK